MSRWRYAAVTAAMLLGAPCHAEARPEVASAPVRAAWHRGHVEGSTVTWRSTFVLDAPHDATSPLRFAVPLERGAVVEGAPGLTPVVEDGRVVGVTGAPAGSGAVRLVARAPFTPSGEAARITPPLAEGGSVQIVDVDGEDDGRFEPAPSSGLTRYVGYYAPAAQSGDARRAAEARVGFTGRGPTEQTLYVEATPGLKARGGIEGAWSTGTDRARASAFGAAVAFALVVAALAAAYRALARSAKVEHAERVLAKEFAELEDDRSTAPPPREESAARRG